MMEVPTNRSFSGHKTKEKVKKKGNKALGKNTMLLLLGNFTKPVTSLSEMNHATHTSEITVWHFHSGTTETIPTTSSLIQMWKLSSVYGATCQGHTHILLVSRQTRLNGGMTYMTNKNEEHSGVHVCETPSKTAGLEGWIMWWSVNPPLAPH